ncbi:DUF4192 domain-containing protein [Aquipuribacter hungaricus]|uniref:DUF4192 domain-containing protein n=3 Tax=Aquipuribacter hungaricus TaxID=545624 RepID=A0ABV7WE61_9MICO
MTTRPADHLPRPRPAVPTVRLQDPAGVVAAVPYLLGFTPRRSLVVVGVDGDRGVGPTLRADLPTSAVLGTGGGGRAGDGDGERAGDDGGVLAAVWQHASQVLRRNGCDRALAVVYADVEPADLGEDAVRRVLDVLDPPWADGTAGPDGAWPDADADADADVDAPWPDGPLDVLDVLLVGPGRFRSLLCPDPACCPRDGSPVVATASHAVAASFVLAGRSPAADRDGVEPEAPAPPPADLRAAADAARAARASTPATDPGGGADEDADLLEQWLGSLPHGPGPALAGRLAARWRTRPLLRDACLAAFLPGGPDLARALLGGGGSPPATLAGSLDDPACAGAVREGTPVLRRLAALVPAEDRAEVLAGHSWLAWVAGEGTAASVLGGRALSLDPTQPLARLVLRALDGGLGAPWTVGGRSGGASWDTGR